MTELNIVLSPEAIHDLRDIESYVASLYRPEAGRRYITRLFSLISDLSFSATSFARTTYKTALLIHPNARTLPIMHRWTIIFHINGDYVIIDKILPSAMVKY